MKATGVCHEEHCICQGCNGMIKKGSKIAYPNHDPDSIFHIGCFKDEKKQKHGGTERFDKWGRFDMMNAAEPKDDRNGKKW